MTLAQAELAVARITRRDPRVDAQLARLLIDAVENGASIGFLSPLTEARARAYWEGVFAELGDGLVLWVAQAGNEIVGSVQLSPCRKENGRHRAEVQKLFVLKAARGRGIARRLLEEAEAFARANGRTLLVLDTQAGSDAEHVYRHLGWHRAGEIPDYAATPRGDLHPTVYYYKSLRA